MVAVIRSLLTTDFRFHGIYWSPIYDQLGGSYQGPYRVILFVSKIVSNKIYESKSISYCVKLSNSVQSCIS